MLALYFNKYFAALEFSIHTESLLIHLVIQVKIVFSFFAYPGAMITVLRIMSKSYFIFYILPRLKLLMPHVHRIIAKIGPTFFLIMSLNKTGQY